MSKSVAEFQADCSRMVQNEVHLCVSSIVSTLASGYGESMHSKDLSGLTEQAFELCSPIDDFEEAAIQEGFNRQSDGTWLNTQSTEESYETAQDACNAHNIDPYQREVYEHWAVSQWLAEQLIAKGERVDTDFAGWNVWARTTTGQAISIDHVIEEIRRDLEKSVAEMSVA